MLYHDVVSCGFEVERCSYGGSFSIQSYLDEKGYQVDRKLKQEYRHNVVKAQLPIFRKVKNRIRKAAFWYRFSDQMKMKDLLIIGGGNMIMDLTKTSKSWLKFASYVDIAKKYNKKVVVLSIGIGPFQTEHQKDKAVEALNKCDFVTYRDRESLKLGSQGLNNNKHFLSLDPVFLLPKVNIPQNQKGKRTIGIGVINTLLFDPSIDRYNNVKQSYIELIKMLLERDYCVVVFSTERADYNMVGDVMNVFEDNRVSSVIINTTDDLLDLYAQKITYLVAARMHALIIAFTQQIPIIGLAWQQKLVSMFKIIDREEYCFPIDKINENSHTIAALVDESHFSATEMFNTTHKLDEIRKKYDINREILESVKK